MKKGRAAIASAAPVAIDTLAKAEIIYDNSHQHFNSNHFDYNSEYVNGFEGQG